MLRKVITKSFHDRFISKVYKNNSFVITSSIKKFSELGSKFSEEKINNEKLFKPIISDIPSKKLKNSNQTECKSTSFSRLEKQNIIKDTNLGLTYTKLEKNDKLLSELLLTARNRNKNNQIIIEGRRLIIEAISCEVELKKIIFSDKEELSRIKEELLKLPKFEIYKVPHHNLKLWSTLTTQPGLLAIFNRPNIPTKQLKNSQNVPITVICDNIREPSNLGSIIRICAALPCSKIIMLKGCCDPWEPKALRSGCGGHFRIDIETNRNWEDMTAQVPSNASVFIADSNILNMKRKDVNVKEYSEVNISSNNYLIIGGETHGISEQAYNFIKYRRGIGIHIPLANNVDSLNTASALSLILFTLRSNLQAAS